MINVNQTLSFENLFSEYFFCGFKAMNCTSWFWGFVFYCSFFSACSGSLRPQRRRARTHGGTVEGTDLSGSDGVRELARRQQCHRLLKFPSESCLQLYRAKRHGTVTVEQVKKSTKKNYKQVIVKKHKNVTHLWVLTWNLNGIIFFI